MTKSSKGRGHSKHESSEIVTGVGSAGTADTYRVYSTSSTEGPHILPGRTIQPRRIRLDDEQLTRAVYSYLQSQKALGHTTVHTDEIASALSLPLRDVHRAVQKLREKGVRAR